MIDYSGKTVFVAGGTSGINLAIAEGFAKASANVFVMSRNAQKVNDAVEKLKNSATNGASASGIAADVRDFQAVHAGFAAAKAAFGELNVLVSGAAGNFPAFANALSSNGFKSVMDIDLLGTFHVMRAGYPHLRRPGAVVINISAPQALLPAEAQVHVCAAKAGVDMVTRVLAMEWGASGVRVLSVVPGPVEGTEGMNRLAPLPELAEKCVNTVPAKRLAQGRDIADACLALASDYCRFINGAVIPVDGGWSLGGFSTAMQDMTSFATESGFLTREKPLE